MSTPCPGASSPRFLVAGFYAPVGMVFLQGQTFFKRSRNVLLRPQERLPEQRQSRSQGTFPCGSRYAVFSVTNSDSSSRSRRFA
jgi:hypothetical protein